MHYITNSQMQTRRSKIRDSLLVDLVDFTFSEGDRLSFTLLESFPTLNLTRCFLEVSRDARCSQKCFAMRKEVGRHSRDLLRNFVKVKVSQVFFTRVATSFIFISIFASHLSHMQVAARFSPGTAPRRRAASSINKKSKCSELRRVASCSQRELASHCTFAEQVARRTTFIIFSARKKGPSASGATRRECCEQRVATRNLQRAATLQQRYSIVSDAFASVHRLSF